MSKRKIKEEVAGPPVSDDSIGSKRRRRGDEARETQASHFSALVRLFVTL